MKESAEQIEQYRRELIKYITENASDRNIIWLHLSAQCCDDYQPTQA